MTEKLSLLEQEGEIAADYLEALLDIADFDGDIDMDVENDRATERSSPRGLAGVNSTSSYARNWRTLPINA
jgi:hypothetical protein